MWVERSEPVEVPLPYTAERFLAVPTDISGVLNTSPTEKSRDLFPLCQKGSSDSCPGRATPRGPLQFNITRTFVQNQDSSSLCQAFLRPILPGSENEWLERGNDGCTKA